jgi:acetyl-CoA carboxylase carboxyltransferase component
MAGMGTTDKNGIDFKIAWPSAERGSLPIEGGVAAAFRREITAARDPKAREREIEAELRSVASPFRTAEAFGVEDIIDPRETRPYVPVHRCSSSQPRDQARPQTQVWSAPVRGPVIEYAKWRSATGRNKYGPGREENDD